MEKIRILLVEDDPALSLLFRRMLAKLGYMVTDVVSTEIAGLHRALSSDPDLVLVDVVVTDCIAGLELAHAVTSTLGIPGIVISSHSAEHLTRRDASIARYRCIRKPFFVEDLAIVISDVMSCACNRDEE